MAQAANLPYIKTVQIGRELLQNSVYNKGLAFTFQERREFNLHGLLPAVYRTLDTQSRQIMSNIERMKDPLDQYVFFMNILDTNAKLFYRTLCENLPTLMPIVYTPTVGLACQKFLYIFHIEFIRCIFSYILDVYFIYTLFIMLLYIR